MILSYYNLFFHILHCLAFHLSRSFTVNVVTYLFHLIGCYFGWLRYLPITLCLSVNICSLLVFSIVVWHRSIKKTIVACLIIPPYPLLSYLIYCSLEVVPPVDHKWGSVGSDGKWNGMVGMVLYGVSLHPTYSPLFW